MNTRKIAVGLAALASALSMTSPASAGELDDTVVRATAVVDSPFVLVDAGLEDAAAATAQAELTQWALEKNQPQCAPPGVNYAHKTQNNLELVILPARDVISVDGYCTYPAILGGPSWSVQMCGGVQRYNPSSRVWGFIWSSCGDTLGAVAGHGFAYHIQTYNHGTNAFPIGWLRGCGWYQQPYNSSASRVCTAPIPVVA